MPYFSEGGSKSPCLYQKKSIYNGQSCHIIPIQTKRPIEKVTTRSQAQYQQLIKTMGTEALLTDKSDGNNNLNNGSSIDGLYFLNTKTSGINGRVASNSGLTNRSTHQTAAKTSRGKGKSSSTSTSSSTTGGHSVSVSSTHSSQDEKIIPVTLIPATTNSTTARKATTTTNYLPCTSAPSAAQKYLIEECKLPDCLPFTPHQVLKRPEFSMHLTHHEKSEITNFSEIYFIGKNGIKKRTPQTPTTHISANGFESKVYGFDDNNGSYIPVIHDHIAYRYEILTVIGRGTFGVVLEAFDHKLQCGVALKVIRNQQRFHTQAKEEIKILTKLLENDADDKFNVVHMYENFMFRLHPCIVFELLSLNLYELSKKNSFAGFTLSLIRRFTFAIVKCLHALCNYDIIHCDLKPENILLKRHDRSGIKVIDFGSSCFANRRVHTYIQSRYYRSPEVILGGKYGPQIDMWSLGCILAELYCGRPLLNGDNERDQLSVMMEFFNVPPARFLSKCKQTKVRQFFDNMGNPTHCALYYDGRYHAVASKSPRGKVREPPGTKMLLPDCKDADFIDFIKKCLTWDPTERMTPSGAMEHPWIVKRTNKASTDNAVCEMMSH